MDGKKEIYPSASEDAQASELYIPTPQTLIYSNMSKQQRKRVKLY